MILTKTLDGIITSWSAAAERLFSYHPEETIGQPITRIIPQEQQQEEPDILERLLQGETIVECETMRPAKDGRCLKVLLNISPLRGSAGQIVGATKSIQDITE